MSRGLGTVLASAHSEVPSPRQFMLFFPYWWKERGDPQIWPLRQGKGDVVWGAPALERLVFALQPGTGAERWDRPSVMASAVVIL